MSRSWDPWRVPAGQQFAILRQVLAPSLVLPAKEPEVEGEKKDSSQNDGFISFLALAQYLEIDFLPITWHPAVETLGAGATAEIRQALVDIQTSLAFKRIGLEHRGTFSALVREISVFGNAEVREHENIVKLVGIGWDVYPNGPTIWPVLVFEKATYGNLEDFMQSDHGRRLSTSQALSLLRDVASALACLHKPNIVHCDIKPDNILVFQHNTKKYYAKVADFGFASLATGTGLVRLATPESWTDPTYKGDYLNASTAKKIESYSFGLVCAWLLHKISSRKSFQSLVDPVLRTDQSQKTEDVFAMFEDFPDLTPPQRLSLREFFNLTLTIDRDKRSADFPYFIELLQGMGSKTSETSPPTDSRDDRASVPLISGLNFSEEMETIQYKFQVSKSLFRLLKADFRLPSFIATQFHKQAETLNRGETKSNAQFQLALCHAIGFGVRRNIERSRQWLSTCDVSNEDLERQIEELRAEDTWPYQNQALKALEAAGSLDLLDTRLWQDAKNILKQVEVHYREEIEDYQHVFDQAHPVMVLTKFRFAGVLDKAGKYEEARDIYVELGRTMEEAIEWGPLNRSTLITWTQAAGMSYKLGKNAEAGTLYLKVLERQNSTLGSLHVETLTTTDTLALVLKQEGKYREAEKLSREALEGRKQVLSGEHPDTLVSMSNLAGILVSAGKLNDARSLLVQCISGRKRIFGKGNGDTMICQSNLSALHNLLGNLSEAERLAEEVLTEMEDTLGLDHPDTFYLLGNLASTMHHLGKDEKARELGNYLLERKDSIGVDNPYHLTVMSNMALILQEEGSYDKSLELDREILQRRISLLGEDHPDTLLTQNNIAAALQRQGKYQEAKTMFGEILSSRQDILGENHPATLDSMGNLAYLLQQMGDYDSALKLHNDTVKGCTTTLGPDHRTTLMSKSNLGTVYLLLGRSDEAVDLFKQTMEARLKLLGESHPHTLQAMDNFAVALDQLGRKEESEKYFRRELQNEPILGRDNLVLLNARNNLGMVLYGEGRLEEARECISIALGGRERLLGPDHPDTLTASFNMGLIHCKEHRYDLAIRKLRIVAERRESILGSHHPDTLGGSKALAAAMGLGGQYEEAETRYRDLVDRAKGRFGENHPESLDLSSRLALNLRQQGRLEEAEKILARVVEFGSQEQGREHSQVLTDRYYLALVRDGLGKHREAEVELRYLLQRKEDELGADHDEVLEIVNALGLVVRNLNRLEEAFELLDRALKGRGKTPGSEIDIYGILALQALVRQDQGDLDAATRLNECALEGWERLVGPENPSTLNVVANLGSVALQRGDGPQALRLHRRALEGRENVLGSLHPDTIDSVRYLAVACFATDSEEEAIPLYERAYSGSCQLYGPNDPRSKEIKDEMAVIQQTIEEEKDTQNDQTSGRETGDTTAS